MSPKETHEDSDVPEDSRDSAIKVTCEDLLSVTKEGNTTCDGHNEEADKSCCVKLDGKDRSVKSENDE